MRHILILAALLGAGLSAGGASRAQSTSWSGAAGVAAMRGYSASPGLAMPLDEAIAAGSDAGAPPVPGTGALPRAEPAPESARAVATLQPGLAPGRRGLAPRWVVARAARAGRRHRLRAL